VKTTPAKILLASGLALTGSAHAQFSSSSGMYFSSAGAAYMNTLSWSSMSRSPEMQKAFSDAEAKVARDNARAASAVPAAAGASASDFRPVDSERNAAFGSLVAGVAPGNARDALRKRLDLLAATVERSMAGRHNLAQATYLLIGMSLQTAGGRPLASARAVELTRAIDAAYANDPKFMGMDDRQRSRMFYTYAATTGLTATLGLSKDPAEVQAGRKLALNTLHAFGIQP
jgi:hypothetical protein